jgi:hypothetical protein
MIKHLIPLPVIQMGFDSMPPSIRSICITQFRQDAGCVMLLKSIMPEFNIPWPCLLNNAAVKHLGFQKKYAFFPQTVVLYSKFI